MTGNIKITHENSKQLRLKFVKRTRSRHHFYLSTMLFTTRPLVCTQSSHVVDSVPPKSARPLLRHSSRHLPSTCFCLANLKATRSHHPGPRHSGQPRAMDLARPLMRQLLLAIFLLQCCRIRPGTSADLGSGRKAAYTGAGQDKECLPHPLRGHRSLLLWLSSQGNALPHVLGHLCSDFWGALGGGTLVWGMRPTLSRFKFQFKFI